jgi:hypothetical protein
MNFTSNTDTSSHSFVSTSNDTLHWSYRSSLASDGNSVQSLHAQPGDFNVSNYSTISHALDETHESLSRFVIIKHMDDFGPVGALCARRATAEVLRIAFAMDAYRFKKEWFVDKFSSAYRLAVERRSEEVNSPLGSRMIGIVGVIEEGKPPTRISYPYPRILTVS